MSLAVRNLLNATLSAATILCTFCAFVGWIVMLTVGNLWHAFGVLAPIGFYPCFLIVIPLSFFYFLSSIMSISLTKVGLDLELKKREM